MTDVEMEEKSEMKMTTDSSKNNTGKRRIFLMLITNQSIVERQK